MFNDNNKVGFEINEGSKSPDEMQYELVTPPTP
jgi:hypothetical protein